MKEKKAFKGKYKGKKPVDKTRPYPEQNDLIKRMSNDGRFLNDQSGENAHKYMADMDSRIVSGSTSLTGSLMAELIMPQRISEIPLVNEADRFDGRQTGDAKTNQYKQAGFSDEVMDD